MERRAILAGWGLTPEKLKKIGKRAADIALDPEANIRDVNGAIRNLIAIAGQQADGEEKEFEIAAQTGQTETAAEDLDAELDRLIEEERLAAIAEAEAKKRAGGAEGGTGNKPASA